MEIIDVSNASSYDWHGKGVESQLFQSYKQGC